MTEEASNKPTTVFWVISGVALLWNIMGVLSYMGTVTITDAAVAELPAAEQALYETPFLITSLFAIAVFTGLLGCVALLLRKKWAKPVFMVSLGAATIQMIYWLFMTDSVAVYGVTSVIMPIAVIAVAIYLVMFAGSSTAKGWLS